ncbi:Odorant receptor 150 [Nylanderia fulva]|uniref:Odorant receptor n=1 Tax=Nylanderia fulva TaxID=613905 RepID=A0A6G1LRB6_9HYME|nr:Odorant receptor 150 [Nylanderia fulva]
MDITWNHYYNVVYKISSVTGAWPYMKPGARIFRLTILTITMLTIFIPQIAYQSTCKKDIYCTFEASTSYLLTFAASLKVYTFQFNISTSKIPRSTKIMKSYAENSRRFSMIVLLNGDIYVYVYVSCTVRTRFHVALNQSRPVIPPYPGYYFVDVREYFLPIFCHSLVAWDILMIGIMAHDCMYVTYVEHVCSLFAVTGHRFERLFYNDRNQLTEVVDRNDMYYKRISFIVHTHRKSLKFAELLEDTFTIPFAIQILIVTMGMSITLLQISQENGPILEKIRYALYVIGQLIHLFLFSLEGQKLIDHSLQTREKIYNSSWYKASVRSQKLIMMVMIKCLRPSFLSAGKIYIFSLESFTTILQTSMSYFTVLASFQ